MQKHPFFKKILSYIVEQPLAVYDSAYNGRLTVCLRNGRTVLDSQHANQSYDTLHKVFRQVFKEINVSELALKNILLLGLGGGSVVHILHKELKLPVTIHAVELDPVVAKIAAKHFDIRKNELLEITIADAAAFIKSASQPYDLTIVDLFHDNLVPSYFLTETFHNDLIKSGKKILFNCMTENKEIETAFNSLLKFYRQQDFKVKLFRLQGTNKVLYAYA